MPLTPVAEPEDAAARRAISPVVVYPNGTLETPDLALLEKARGSMEKIDEVIVPPRDGRTFNVPKGHFPHRQYRRPAGGGFEPLECA